MILLLLSEGIAAEIQVFSKKGSMFVNKLSGKENTIHYLDPDIKLRSANIFQKQKNDTL